MKAFITFTRRPWYHKKRYVIPKCMSIILVTAAIILGCVLGTRTKLNPPSMIFDIFFSLKENRSSL
jgi:hypothetical protein